MAYYSVRAHALNLRTQPRTAPNNRIALLPQGLRVEKLEEGRRGWWRVKAFLNGAEVQGWAPSEYLDPVAGTAPADESPPTSSVSLPPVHMESGLAKRTSRDARHARLGELDQPRRNGAEGAAQRVAALNAIIDYLNVEQSARYLPGGGQTYCNIYAADYCYLADCYLPRVWWTEDVIASIAGGAPPPPVRYGQTVRELNANSLYNWLRAHGAAHGWRRTFSLDELQQSANAGGVGVIVGHRVDGSKPGHITIVAPEADGVAAERRDQSVRKPLQSQAGTRNFKRRPDDFWVRRAADFSDTNFWIHA